MGYRYGHHQEVFCFCLKSSLCAKLSGTPITIVSPSPLSLTSHLPPPPAPANPGHPPAANHLPSVFTCFSHRLLKFSMLDAKMCIFPLNPQTHPNLSVSLSVTLPPQSLEFTVSTAFPLHSLLHLPTAFRHPWVADSSSGTPLNRFSFPTATVVITLQSPIKPRLNCYSSFSQTVMCVRVTWESCSGTDSGPVDPGRGLRICISNKLLRDDFTAGPRTPRK